MNKLEKMNALLRGNVDETFPPPCDGRCQYCIFGDDGDARCTILCRDYYRTKGAARRIHYMFKDLDIPVYASEVGLVVNNYYHLDPYTLKWHPLQDDSIIYRAKSIKHFIEKALGKYIKNRPEYEEWETKQRSEK